ncbi:pentatricopeptide repeat-containing protein At4g18520, chloroplastic-like isoform X1 [Selaginella moellendorffii]|uniref:pentatricopeptide repeat-containing protein At4g18520, chloroplastic-like isoform X1 n=1 Tax=Selaginella moellendorffii TaxID=88036 RepID=UPI000D1C50CB|nr:pentatricopeptide repeat-containing protein At4g18520, chloroplastic-like isoform X1 [Selaginella moellendorffii]|eukprot:XP_024545380.1 pentatricopeptide repeat-containing protein At4g18520, chloroplastic-like isoform X1 [Selaginella moellendorffii]
MVASAGNGISLRDVSLRENNSNALSERRRCGNTNSQPGETCSFNDQRAFNSNDNLKRKDSTIRRSIPALLATLKSCSSKEELEQVLAKCGRDGNVFLANTSIDMYARFGSLVEARRVFDDMKQRTVVSWNAIIKAYSRSGEKDLALKLFSTMLDQGFQPDARTFVAVLGACAGLAAGEDGRELAGKMVKVFSLERAMAFHSELSRSDLESNRFLASTLLDFYVKCGSLEDARRVFDGIQDRSVSSWNVMILGYAENDQGEVALELFSLMQRTRGGEPDARTFLAAAIACTSLAARESAKLLQGKLVKVVSLERGMVLHKLLGGNLPANLFVGSTLINLYAKCRSMVDASRVFEKMRERDAVLWTALLLGFVESKEDEAALEVFSRMLLVESLAPDSRTIVAVLRACSSLAAKEESQRLQGRDLKIRWLETGMTLHAMLAELGHSANIFVANTLVDMYAKCGSMDNARLVFDSMQRHSVVSWTAMVSGYMENHEGEISLKYFEAMLAEGFATDAQAYLPALMACTSLAEKEEPTGFPGDRTMMVKVLSLERGMAVHSRARRSGDDSNSFVATSLINMYAKCGSLGDAERVFFVTRHRSSVLWTSMIMALAEGGEGKMALDLFQRMQDEGVEPDSRAFIAALSACSGLASKGEKTKKLTGRQQQQQQQRWLETGMELHSRAAKLGLEADIFVANTLVDMYSKCKCMYMARWVFEGMQQRSIVSWNAIISGYVEAGESHTALELFQRLQQQQEDPAPNAQTFVPALKACTILALFEVGRKIHASIREAGPSDCVLLANALIVFYGKCGSMAEAEEVFASIQRQQHLVLPVIIWNNLLAGYSQCGDSKSVLETFERMTKDRSVAPDGTTFLWLLSACSHSGLVEDGKCYLEAMARDYGIAPGVEHYNCVVDLLGRANLVEESVAVAESMLVEADSMVWKTVLCACIEWKDLENGRAAFQRMVELDESDSAAYVLMAKLYSQCGIPLPIKHREHSMDVQRWQHEI